MQVELQKEGVANDGVVVVLGVCLLAGDLKYSNEAAEWAMEVVI